MCDTLNSASRISSLVQAFAQGPSENDQYVTKMKTSHPQNAREYLTLTPQNTPSITGANSVTFDLAKSGFLRQAMIKISLVGLMINGAYSSTGALGFKFAKMLSCAIVSSVSLRTPSRTLLTIPSDRLARLISDSPNAKMLKHLGGWDWDGTPVDAAHDTLGLKGRSTGSNPTLYLPLNFAPFLNMPHASLCTSFAESLQIVVALRPQSVWCENVGATNATTGLTNLTGITVELCVDSTCLAHEVYKTTIAETYKPGSSSQILLEDCTLLAESVMITPQAATVTTKSHVLTTSATSVIRSIMCVAVPETNIDGSAVWVDTYPEVQNVKFYASGREIFNQSRATADIFRAMNGDERSNGTGAANAHVIDFAMDPTDPSYYSGSCAAAGLSSQRFEINVRTNSLAPYRIRIYSIAYSVKSILADSGSVISSLST